MTNPDPQGLLRRLMAGAVGTVCEIEGTVHVHLSDEHDADAAATADVLLEVMAERERQRQKHSNYQADGRTIREWELLHERKLDQAICSRPVAGTDRYAVQADRAQLIRALAELTAHVEAINRRREGSDE